MSSSSGVVSSVKKSNRIALVGVSTAGCDTLAYRIWGDDATAVDARPHAREAPVNGTNDILVHIHNHNRDSDRDYPTLDERTGASRDMIDELRDCHTLIILWSFDGLWFPRDDIDQWLHGWNRAHAECIDTQSPAISNAAPDEDVHFALRIGTLDPEGRAQQQRKFCHMPYRVNAYRPMSTRPVFLVGNKADLCPQVLPHKPHEEASASTSHEEASTPHEEASTPHEEASTPHEEASTPHEEASTSYTSSSSFSSTSPSPTTVDSDNGDFKTLCELEAFETATSDVLLDLHMASDVFRLFLSYFSDRNYLCAQAFLAEAAIAATQTRSEGKCVTPVLYCSALTGEGVKNMWERVRR
jgi:hypothetical protein